MNSHPVKYLIVLLIISIAYSSMSVVADCFRLEGSLEPIVHFYGTTVNILLAVGCHALFVFALGSVLFWAWSLFGARNDVSENERHIQVKTVCLVALLIMLAWLPWMFAHYPGTVRDDTFPQMFQWYGKHNYYTQHPVADTLFFGLFFSIGDLLGSRTLGLFIYLIFQAAVTSLVFSVILHYMWKHGVPTGLLVISLLFFAFSRVIYQPVDAMSKDSLSGIFFCLLALGVVEIIRTDMKVLRNKAFVVSFFMGVVLCVVTKRTMQYVLLIIFAACLIYFLVKRANPIRFLLISFVPIVLGSSIVIPAINISVGASENETFEMYSVPAQQIVRVLIVHPDAINEEEYDRLSRFIDIEEAVDVYNYWRSDEVTGCIRDSGEFSSCLDIWAKLGLSYPSTYFCAWLGMNANWFSLTESINYGHDTHAELMTEERVEGWVGFFESEEEAKEFLATLDFSRIDFLEPLYSLLEHFDLMQSDLYAVSSYGLYCTLSPLLLFAYSLIARNGKMIVATFIPLALIASLFVGPIALYWYTVPVVYLFPLLLVIPIVLRDDPITVGRMVSASDE